MALRHEFQWAADSALPKLPRAWSRELELLFRSEHKDVPAIEEKVGGVEGRREEGQGGKLPRAWSRALELLLRSEHKDVPAIEGKVGGADGKREGQGGKGARAGGGKGAGAAVQV